MSPAPGERTLARRRRAVFPSILLTHLTSSPDPGVLEVMAAVNQGQDPAPPPSEPCTEEPCGLQSSGL